MKRYFIVYWQGAGDESGFIEYTGSDYPNKNLIHSSLRTDLKSAGRIITNIQELNKEDFQAFTGEYNK